MEERISWGEAFSVAWNNLTGVNNEGGSIRNIRLLFFAIFIGGTAWAAYNYHNAQILLEERVFTPQVLPAELDADKKRLNNMVTLVKVTSEMRANSLILAQSMEDMGKYAFADPSTPDPSRKDTVVVMPDMELPVIDPPPAITVRAIMTMGKQQVAVMDIEGVGSGMVVKAGDTFMQKKGRVVRIASNKVVVRWSGKTFDVGPVF